jgi:hypothetical protein
MATYRRRRRAVCLTRARSPTSRSKEDRRADEQFQKEARVLRHAESAPEPLCPALLFIHGTRRFRKPAVQQYRVRQRSHQKTPRNHFERGQRLHHLATSSAPDDSVKLVPLGQMLGRRRIRYPSLQPSSFSLRLRRKKNRRGPPFALYTTRRRPTATSPRPTSSLGREAHVGFGPL